MPSNKEPWDILQEDDSGSYLANDSEYFGPEPSFIFLAEPLPCG
jgi:hypothetical protein